MHNKNLCQRPRLLLSFKVMYVLLQLETLPRLVHQHIACKLAELGGGANFRSLRLCSHYWNLVCNDEIVSVLCQAEQLVEAMPFLCGLPKLDNLTIQGSNVAACTVGQDSLIALGQKLNSLKLAADQITDNGSVRVPILTVENINGLLLPWTQSLQFIHLVNCRVTNSGDTSLLTPGLFSKFPCLVHLELSGIHSTPELKFLDLGVCRNLRKLNCGNNGIDKLDVSGCNELLYLNCWNNNLPFLELSGCAKLTCLECHDNVLAALDLTGCPQLMDLCCVVNALEELDLSQCKHLTALECHTNPLTVLDFVKCPDFTVLWCGNEELTTIILPASLKMERLDCSYSNDSLTVSGGALFLDLHCSGRVYRSFSTEVHAQVQKLQIEDLVTWDLVGNQQLQVLECYFGPTGSIDLSESTVLELTFNSQTSNLPLLGLKRGTVLKLTMSGTWCLGDLTGFTMLTKLDCNLTTCPLTVLDLSFCRELHKVRILGSYVLASINLTGCSCLTDFDLVHAPGMSELNLKSCKNLAVMRCFGSGLTSLDVSFSPLLTSLDICNSKMLVTLNTGGLERLKVLTDGCPMLQGMQPNA